MTEESKAVVPQRQAGAVTVAGEDKISREKIIKYLESTGTNLPQGQMEQFIEIAQAHNLNPFKREIYGVAYGSNFNIIVGYEVYLKRADKTDTLDGWRVWTEGEGIQMVAKIEIFRKDRGRPFVWEVEMKEYDQNNSMWKKKAKTMLKKVVIGQGFRLCFPNDFDGMPYLSEEIEVENQNGTPQTSQATVIEEEPERAAPATEETLGNLHKLLEDENLTEKYRAEWIAALESRHPTQEDAEKSIANINAMIRKMKVRAAEAAAEAIKNPKPQEQPEKAPDSLMFKKMHTLGVKVHGDKWETVRPEMVKGINKDKTSSKDLDPAELSEFINRLEIEESEL